MTRFECTIPILRVRSLAVSIGCYVNALGFRLDWGGEEGSAMASVSRDGCAIVLCVGDQGQPGTWVWIGIEDAEALCDEYRARGAVIRQELTNHPWALEMRLEDPDGHVLRFGSERLTDRPFA